MTKRNSKFEWETTFIQSEMSGNTGFVGLLVATLDNGDGRGFFVSASSISRWTGLNEKTARTQLKKLMETGWLVRTQRGGRRGGRVLASEYRLEIPEGVKPTSLGGQPDSTRPQPEDVVPQQGTETHPLDQDSLDQDSLDHSLLDAPLHLNSLAPGDEVTGEQRSQLKLAEQDLFVPAFTEGDFWNYEPEITAKTSTIARQAASQPMPAPSRRQHQRFVRVNREEGLDANGEPLGSSDRSPGYRSRR